MCEVWGIMVWNKILDNICITLFFITIFVGFINLTMFLAKIYDVIFNYELHGIYYVIMQILGLFALIRVGNILERKAMGVDGENN